jgi:hypothetical protein
VTIDASILQTYITKLYNIKNDVEDFIDDVELNFDIRDKDKLVMKVDQFYNLIMSVS